MPSPTRCFDGWVLHCDTGDLRKGGTTTRLTQQPLKVLLALLERPGEVVTRQHLIRVLWPAEVVDFDNSLNAAVRKLRLALGDDAEAPRYVETLARIGYRFIGRVEPPPQAPPRQRLAHWVALIVVILFASEQIASRGSAPGTAPAADPPATAPRQRPQHGVRAYELYLEGVFDRFRRDRDGLPDAIAHFQAALREDPSYAEAWSALAEALSSQGVLQYEPPGLVFPRARTAALHAVALDDDLAEAHTALGHVYMQFDRDYAAAEREFERARALNDHYSPLWHLSAFLHAYQGRAAEALAAMRRARELEPMNPVYGANFGLLLYQSGANDAAVSYLSELLVAQPRIDQAHSFLAKALLERGDLDGAARHLQARGRPTLGMAELGRLHARAGRRAEALAEVAGLESLGARGFGVGYDIATIYAALGETHQACVALERALADHSQMLGWLPLDPALASLRTERCFADVDQRRALRRAPPALEGAAAS